MSNRKIIIHNSLTGKKEELQTLQKDHVKMYVCGPTVYERPHLGNARSIVVYDTLFRLLQKIYPQVTYVRNITDLDDKINDAAKIKNISIQQLTTGVLQDFYQDMQALQVLRPTFEPKATQHISEIIAMISRLLQNGHAYESKGHVLFDVNSFQDYGKLSNRSTDEMISGVRIEVGDYKKNPLDFVLWKPKDDQDDPSIIFDSPFGKGRPGWHIECSAMSTKYLGKDFDIHGGGADLQFPHHENEIAQSCCANENSHFAKYWIHNGFLTVNGEKMSKSLKNFITVHDALSQGNSGITVRYLLLSSHYRKPLDYNEKSLDDAKKSLDKFYSALDENLLKQYQKNGKNPLSEEILENLCDDLNTAKVFAFLHELVKKIKSSTHKQKEDLQQQLMANLDFLGLFDENYFSYKSNSDIKDDSMLDESFILNQIELRKKAKAEKNWQLADEIRKNLLAKNIILEDKPNGETLWKIDK